MRTPTLTSKRLHKKKIEEEKRITSQEDESASVVPRSFRSYYIDIKCRRLSVYPLP